MPPIVPNPAGIRLNCQSVIDKGVGVGGSESLSVSPPQASLLRDDLSLLRQIPIETKHLYNRVCTSRLIEKGDRSLIVFRFNLAYPLLKLKFCC